ncbi:MAG: hypothetical protein JRI68_33865 [Deltaproteobacteria bacterium]|nr:hypothetical protein [Deltaproteobacteria bacterium]
MNAPSADLACLIMAWGLATTAGCGALLGMDKDYELVALGDGGGGTSSTSTTTSGTGGTAGVGGVGGVGGTGGAGGDPATCADVTGASGIYTIDPDGEGAHAPFETYCEQDIAGGGWTLIARSAPGGTGNMGWRVDRGSVSAAGPYSLDVVGAGLTVDTLLLLSRGNDQAYTMGLPSNFLTDFDQSGTSVEADVAHVSGSCTPSGGVPTMLRFAGYTAKQNVFFFRDMANDSIDFGLFADRFGFTETDCDKDGGLDGEPGEIFGR